jgi:hypothetical protein
MEEVVSFIDTKAKKSIIKLTLNCCEKYFLLENSSHRSGFPPLLTPQGWLEEWDQSIEEAEFRRLVFLERRRLFLSALTCE